MIGEVFVRCSCQGVNRCAAVSLVAVGFCDAMGWDRRDRFECSLRLGSCRSTSATAAASAASAASAAVQSAIVRDVRYLSSPSPPKLPAPMKDIVVCVQDADHRAKMAKLAREVSHSAHPFL